MPVCECENIAVFSNVTWGNPPNHKCPLWTEPKDQNHYINVIQEALTLDGWRGNVRANLWLICTSTHYDTLPFLSLHLPILLLDLILNLLYSHLLSSLFFLFFPHWHSGVLTSQCPVSSFVLLLLSSQWFHKDHHIHFTVFTMIISYYYSHYMSSW